LAVAADHSTRRRSERLAATPVRGMGNALLDEIESTGSRRCAATAPRLPP